MSPDLAVVKKTEMKKAKNISTCVKSRNMTIRSPRSQFVKISLRLANYRFIIIHITIATNV